MPLPRVAPTGSVRPVGLPLVGREDRPVESSGGCDGRPDGDRLVGDGSHGTVRCARSR